MKIELFDYKTIFRDSSVDSSILGDKLNELICAVNRLMEMVQKVIDDFIATELQAARVSALREAKVEIEGRGELETISGMMISKKKTLAAIDKLIEPKP